MQRDALSEEQRREYGEAIENTATACLNLISNILKLNKLENQEKQSRRQKCMMCADSYVTAFCNMNLPGRKRGQDGSEMEDQAKFMRIRI